MYSTCIHCHASLGANETIEQFPVGRRLAFDPAKGRLWVICPQCRQWNLSPLDERWEAIESAERLYRDSKLRASTDQVGLARMRDGTELIRIGAPVLPEMAAWRYGPRFETRYRRHVIGVAAAATIVGGYLVAGPVLGVVAGGAWGAPMNVLSLGRILVGARRVVARIDDEEGPGTLTSWHLATSRVIALPDDPLRWGISIQVKRQDVAIGRYGKVADAKDPRITLSGERARAAAGMILTRANSTGGRRRAVDDAVRLLERFDSPQRGYLQAAAIFRNEGSSMKRGGIAALPIELRLAMEMATHEESERRALEGELAALEASWKEAEEIAAIADSLTLPEQVLTRLERLAGRL
ncbi:MAG: hypothetical protein K8S21_09300 [Gemmatimonadetes bacterium]|nr:hypothetical protein [Gemmatimonadota bacterium]